MYSWSWRTSMSVHGIKMKLQHVLVQMCKAFIRCSTRAFELKWTRFGIIFITLCTLCCLLFGWIMMRDPCFEWELRTSLESMQVLFPFDTVWLHPRRSKVTLTENSAPQNKPMAYSKATFSSSINDFTFEVYKNIVTSKHSENAFMSTISVMVAMTMLHVGARNNTEKQMAKVLKLSNMDKETLLTEVQTFVEVLTQGDQDVKLETAYKLYPNNKNLIECEYIKTVRKHFKAEVESLDYSARAEESRMEINMWVEEKTNGKIKDLLPSGSITSHTAMVVVNAIYFKGNWDEQFDPAHTRNAPFFINQNEKIDVKMMEKELKNVKYTKSHDLACKVLVIPYIGENLGMVILLPDDRTGLSTLEKNISTAPLRHLMGTLSKKKVMVQLPKFKLEAKYEMKDLLRALGMVDLFDDELADLTGMGKDLFVSDMFHKAFVEVNEEGTEAASATGVVMMAVSSSPTFIADHPFLFMIWDHRLEVPLFIGRLVNPSS